MIVSCPACATRFSLDASLLGPTGRNVRCAKCGHRWRQEAPAPIESLPPPPLDVAVESPGSAAPAQEMAPGLAALLGGREAKPAAPIVVPPKLKPAQPKRKVGIWPWILLLGILCGLAVAAYIYQGPITNVFPKAGSIYDALGLGETDPKSVLEIGNIKTEQRSGLLAVRGDVFNPSEHPVKVPPLVIIPKDAENNRVADQFFFRTQETEIAPGETITFRILYDKPKGMQRLSVVFGDVTPAK